MPLEKNIERAAVNKARTRGWSSRKNESRFGGGYPDRLFWKCGRYVWIEFKQPGKKPTRLQEATMRRLVSEGCYVAACTGVRSCMEILDAVEAMCPPLPGKNLTPESY